MEVKVIGGGLAGVEAAYALSKAGVEVKLYEMRPRKMTPAHSTGYLAEVVCSNSFGATSLSTPSGLLKAEMEAMDSLVLKVAKRAAVPAGQALAVDREAFAREVTEFLESLPGLEVVREEVREIPPGPVIIATGPLTSEELSRSIVDLTGRKNLFFYDATSPIVSASSIDMGRAFVASRYGKGGADYINCPMTEEEYMEFWKALVEAETVPLHDFEKHLFESCLPIEELARRGPQTLIFGPLKPVGLVDPRTGEMPYAVVQLRQDNIAATLYSMVGFQTRLKWGEQKRVFSMIPCLRRAEFVKYGVMHRNTYINSPALLLPTLQFRKKQDVFFAGQIVGVEGYMESAATGIMAGIFAAALVKGREISPPPPTTAIGSLLNYVSRADWRNFQPMNFVFGLLPPLKKRIRKRRERRLALSRRALRDLEDWKEGELARLL